MKQLLILTFTALLAFGTINQSQAQCRKYAKKKCVPSLEPYIFNGQMNSAVLNEGDVAELVLTFYAGQDYRILICGEEQLGNIGFRLKDTKENSLFDNRDHDFASNWDFKSNTTQRLIVEIEIPESNQGSETIRNGCVAILIGFKEGE